MAVYWPTPGFKWRTFKLCVLNRWDLNFCVRNFPLRSRKGSNSACLTWQQTKGNRNTRVDVTVNTGYDVNRLTTSQRVRSALDWRHIKTHSQKQSIAPQHTRRNNTARLADVTPERTQRETPQSPTRNRPVYPLGQQSVLFRRVSFQYSASKFSIFLWDARTIFNKEKSECLQVSRVNLNNTFTHADI